jgi:hypothetical protein
MANLNWSRIAWTSKSLTSWSRRYLPSHGLTAPKKPTLGISWHLGLGQNSAIFDETRKNAKLLIPRRPSETWCGYWVKQKSPINHNKHNKPPMPHFFTSDLKHPFFAWKIATDSKKSRARNSEIDFASRSIEKCIKQPLGFFLYTESW